MFNRIVVETVLQENILRCEANKAKLVRDFGMIHSQAYITSVIDDMIELRLSAAQIEIMEVILEIPESERYQLDFRIKR